MPTPPSLQAVLEGLEDGVVVLDDRGRPTCWNLLAERLLGDAPDPARWPPPLPEGSRLRIQTRDIPGGTLAVLQEAPSRRSRHELRNMLSAVVWLAEALTRDQELSPRHRRSVGDLHEAAVRAAALLSRDESRPDSSVAGAPPPAAGVVLVVDDEPCLLAVLADYLQAEGNRVLATGSGREALALAEGEPHLRAAVLDLTLADGDGLDLARRLRSSRPGLRVVFLSGDPQAGSRVGPEDGVILVKPVSLALLAATLGPAAAPNDSAGLAGK